MAVAIHSPPPLANKVGTFFYINVQLPHYLRRVTSPIQSKLFDIVLLLTINTVKCIGKYHVLLPPSSLASDAYTRNVIKVKYYNTGSLRIDDFIVEYFKFVRG